MQVNHKFNMYEFRSRYVKIIYEDAFLLVVEKGEGILTSSVPGARENSVKQILDEYVRRGRSASLCSPFIVSTARHPDCWSLPSGAMCSKPSRIIGRTSCAIVDT